MSKPKCPTPRKKSYPSRGAAETAMRKMPQASTEGMLYVPARAYRCRCGSYHLSARPRPFRRR